MQTFMPEDTFTASAHALDHRRLGKQRVEAKQIYLALTNPDYGWQNHPAVLMWRGHEGALLMYGHAMSLEWAHRGYKDNLMPFFEEEMGNYSTFPYPPWMCDQRLHNSHRSNLLRKDPEWYSQYQWDVPHDLIYFWPTKEEDYAHVYAA